MQKIGLLDSHVAPIGAWEVAQGTVRSNEQFEPEPLRKEFQRQNESDFERTVAAENIRVVIWSPMCGKAALVQCFRKFNPAK